jgi:hypothetical protein
MPRKRCPRGFHRINGKCTRHSESSRDEDFDELLKTRPELHAYSDFDKELIRNEIKREKLSEYLRLNYFSILDNWQNIMERLI